MAKSAVFDYPHFGKVIFIFAAMLFISCAILGGCRKPFPGEGFCGCARAEGFSSGSGPAIFYFLGVKWCGYCKNAKPEWDAFVKKLEADGVTGVVAKYVDSEEDPATAAAFKVESYPTFILVRADGKQIPYEGGRSADAFYKFVKKNM